MTDDKRGYAAMYEARQLHYSVHTTIAATYVGFATALITAVWALLLQKQPSGPPSLTPELVACSVSAVTVGLWRVIGHNADNTIVGLFGDMVLCEGELGLPPDSGITGLVVRSVLTNPSTRAAFLAQTPGQRKCTVDFLAATKRMNYRDQQVWDIVALLGIAVMTTACFVSWPEGQRFDLTAKLVLYVALGLGVALVALAFFRGQKKACAEQLLEAASHGQRHGPAP
jgi:hypothetical protein